MNVRILISAMLCFLLIGYGVKLQAEPTESLPVEAGVIRGKVIDAKTREPMQFVNISVRIISEETGDSPKQVQRYIKMADLIPELLEKVDDGSMGFTPAVQIAYLKKKEQGTYFYIHCSLYNPYLNDIEV